MLYVGRVIGKGGEMIRDLQARSGCRIDVDQNVPEGAPRIITYKGTRTTIDFAKQLVSVLCREGGSEADLPLGQAVKKLVLVPASVIGKVIGRGGEMIRELQSKSSAKVQVDHSIMGDMRHVNVTGTEQAVAKADEMIQFIAANPAVDAHEAITMLMRDKAATNTPWGSGPPYPNLPNQGAGMPASNDASGGMYGGGVAYGQQQPVYGGYMQQPQQQAMPYGQPFQTGPNGIASEMVPCEKMYMGRIIGQKGVTINDLQKRSGCDIQINQNVPMGQPCEICIKGTMQSIMMAKQMIQEIIELGPNHSYAGGRKWSHVTICCSALQICTYYQFLHIM
jgi:far upstream element-binding protein